MVMVHRFQYGHTILDLKPKRWDAHNPKFLKQAQVDPFLHVLGPSCGLVQRSSIRQVANLGKTEMGLAASVEL